MNVLSGAHPELNASLQLWPRAGLFSCVPALLCLSGTRVSACSADPRLLAVDSTSGTLLRCRPFFLCSALLQLLGMIVSSCPVDSLHAGHRQPLRDLDALQGVCPTYPLQQPFHDGIYFLHHFCIFLRVMCFFSNPHPTRCPICEDCVQRR